MAAAVAQADGYSADQHSGAAASPAPGVEKEFSRGAAAFGFSPADGYADPDQRAPDAWVLQFRRQHADAAVWSGLFSSCRGGRDFALIHARTAVLTLRCADAVPDDGWRAQLAAVRQALETRGAASTSLRVQPIGEAGMAKLSLLLGQLWGAGVGVTAVVMLGRRDVSSLMIAVAAAFPNATHVSLWSRTLPPRTQWPRLTSLNYYGPSSHVLLRSHLLADRPLTSLKLPVPLTDQLLSTLTGHAPHLMHLRVHNLELSTDSVSDRGWGVTQLGCGVWYPLAHEVVPMLMALPRPRAGRMSVLVTCARHFDMLIRVTTHAGLNPAVAERLALWRLSAGFVTVRCDGVPPADQPTALQHTLAQLADMQAPDALVRLQGWLWTAELADTAAVYMPALQHLKMGVRLPEPLTDELLAVVLRLGPRHVSVPSLALQSDHSGVAWPVAELAGETLDVTQLLRLPTCSELQLQPYILDLAACGGMSEADFTHLLLLLHRVRVQRREERDDWYFHYSSRGLTIRVQGGGVERQAAVMRRLRTKYSDFGATVQVIGCNMDQTAVAALSRSLPKGVLTHLHFVDCNWPLPPSEYKTLGYKIPGLFQNSKYSEDSRGQQIVLWSGHSKAVARHICEGYVERRRKVKSLDGGAVITNSMTISEDQVFPQPTGHHVRLLASIWQEGEIRDYDWPGYE